MRVFSLHPGSVVETDALPEQLPAQGFVWMAFARREFEVLQHDIQLCLEQLCGAQIVDLHMLDVLNNQLPSHYDYTSDYNLMVFRRLATSQTETNLSNPGALLHRSEYRGGPPVLHRIDTSPVAFVVFDRVLVTVHPTDCSVRDAFAARLLSVPSAAPSLPAHRMPASPADLMLRIIGMMVDGYLDLRRELTRQLDHWQSALINPDSRFNNWNALLDARLALHHLDEICEDQRAAVQDWIDALDAVATEDIPHARTFELLKVRSRDVLEHIERVIHHVRRLEQSAETAVQIHFNVQSNRTNDIMRTLTVLTAIFLPLNLITGYFGMNFEAFPVLHEESALWWTTVLMGALAVVLVIFFWRKRYLRRSL
jgi:magnesium transporter